MEIIMSAGSREINKCDHGRCQWKGVAVPQYLHEAEVTRYRMEGIRKFQKTSKIQWEDGI